ncbi:hypothetical protein [Plantactinospora sp. GCM10030261]|uniref:hypothetical protein n=1 Tax=Plantactinospora sp. GCM10030261 TaxID=3273420 RepID=UPI0036179CDA
METGSTRQGVRTAEVNVQMVRGAMPPARLSFDSGAAYVEVRSAGPDSEELLAARFSEPVPLTWTAQHNVHVEYPLTFRLRRRSGPNLVRLNPTVPWALDVHGGAAHLDADLTGIDLHSVACHSGAAHVRFALGAPAGARTLRFASVKTLVVERPAGVPVRLEIAKGAVNVVLDQRSFGAVGGGLADQTDGYRPDGPGYRIVVSGGADTVTVREGR